MNKKIKQIDSRGWKGSYTVEAALIFGMTFLILASLLLATFYIHDRAVLQAMTCEGASTGSNFFKSSDRKEAAGKVKKQVKEARLLGSKNLSGTIGTGNKEVQASWKASYPIMGFAKRYFGKERLQIQTKWASKVLDPAKTIRKIRGAGEILTGGTK